MELTPRRKSKSQKTKAQPQTQWRLRAPVSKADKDAIHAFQRALKSRDWIVEQLKAAQLKVQKDFEMLKRRGQIEQVTPVTDTSATIADTDQVTATTVDTDSTNIKDAEKTPE